MTIYLYVKTHTITGLKYLGKTKNDPLIYLGSGVHWTRHLKKHGNEHSTEVLRECQSNEEVKEWGLYYSNLWNVVESKEWANLAPETGDGGYRPNNHLSTTYNKQPRPKEHNERISKTLLGRSSPHSADNARKSASKISEKMTGKNTGRRIVIRDGQRRYAYPGDVDYPKSEYK